VDDLADIHVTQRAPISTPPPPQTSIFFFTSENAFQIVLSITVFSALLQGYR
jgi:hypothetical protein